MAAGTPTLTLTLTLGYRPLPTLGSLPILQPFQVSQSWGDGP